MNCVLSTFCQLAQTFIVSFTNFTRHCPNMPLLSTIWIIFCTEATDFMCRPCCHSQKRHNIKHREIHLNTVLRLFVFLIVTFVSFVFVAPRYEKNCIEVKDYVAVAFKIDSPYQRDTHLCWHMAGGVIISVKHTTWNTHGRVIISVKNTTRKHSLTALAKMKEWRIFHGISEWQWSCEICYSELLPIHQLLGIFKSDSRDRHKTKLQLVNKNLVVSCCCLVQRCYFPFHSGHWAHLCILSTSFLASQGAL